MNIQEVIDTAREVAAKAHVRPEIATALLMQMRVLLAETWDAGYKAGAADATRAMDFGPYTPQPRKNPYRSEASDA